ncbi:MAG: alkaline phosphatase family protein [Candidatus Microthrix sp.]|nr:alkaline phosphatase family protein [Candidatus Microthrix sp.]
MRRATAGHTRPGDPHGEHRPDPPAALLGVGPIRRRQPDRPATGRCPAGPPGRRLRRRAQRRTDHLVVFLLDGCNANLLAGAVASGGANIAALAAGGTTFSRGVFASLPTATLANHTTALTGAAGHSGVINHAWYDRGEDTGEPVVLRADVSSSKPRRSVDRDALLGGRPQPARGLHQRQLRVLRHRGELLSLCPGSDGVTSGLLELDDVTHLTADPGLRSAGTTSCRRVDHLSVTRDQRLPASGRRQPAAHAQLVQPVAFTDEAAHEVGPITRPPGRQCVTPTPGWAT